MIIPRIYEMVVDGVLAIRSMSHPGNLDSSSRNVTWQSKEITAFLSDTHQILNIRGLIWNTGRHAKILTIMRRNTTANTVTTENFSTPFPKRRYLAEREQQQDILVAMRQWPQDPSLLRKTIRLTWTSQNKGPKRVLPATGRTPARHASVLAYRDVTHDKRVGRWTSLEGGPRIVRPHPLD